MKNIGDGVADKSIAILFVDGSGLYGLDVDSLSAGSTQTILFDWRTECGNHEIKIFADGFKQINESNEANNEQTKSIYVKCPSKRSDLVIQDISWSPSNPKQGDKVTIKTEVKNQGEVDAGEFDIYYDVLGGYYTRSHINGLPAGSTTTASITWKNAYKCGDIGITAHADIDDNILETSEKNNARTEFMHVECSPTPDLIISDISVNPKNPIINDTVKFKVTVKNTGIKTIKDSYIQVDCWNTDTNNALFFIGKSCPSLKSGETHSYYKSAQVNDSGQYRITICVKSKGRHLCKDITFTVSSKPNIDKSYIDFVSATDSCYSKYTTTILREQWWGDLSQQKYKEELEAWNAVEKDYFDVIDSLSGKPIPVLSQFKFSYNAGKLLIDFIKAFIIEPKKVQILDEITWALYGSTNWDVISDLNGLCINGNDLEIAYEKQEDLTTLLKSRRTKIIEAYGSPYKGLYFLDFQLFNKIAGKQDETMFKYETYRTIHGDLTLILNKLSADFAVTTSVLNKKTGGDLSINLEEASGVQLESHCLSTDGHRKNQVDCFGYFSEKGDTDEYKIIFTRDLRRRSYINIHRKGGELQEKYYLLRGEDGVIMATGDNINGLLFEPERDKATYILMIENLQSNSGYEFIIDSKHIQITPAD